MCSLEGFPRWLNSKKSTCNAGQEDTLQEGMATHSSILVWRIPWIEKHDRLWSI